LDEVEAEAAAGSDCAVYKTEKDVVEFYKKIKSRSHTSSNAMAVGTDVTLLKPRKVYIAENIMTIDPSKKMTIPNSYNINFYENAYKRVFMWHLAQRHDVCLFRTQET